MKTYIYGGKTFKTKNDLTIYVREIIAKYKENETLDYDDFNFMMELLENHQRVDEKIGCGIKEMRKIRTAYNTFCLQIIRLDGSKTDFSWTSCIIPRNSLYGIKKACRESIFYDIQNFKDRSYTNNNIPICPITKQNIPKEDAHVHHLGLSFDEIFTSWVNERNIKPPDIQIKGNEDDSTARYFVDIDISKDFRKYHNSKANLEIISKTAHLRLPKSHKDDF